MVMEPEIGQGEPFPYSRGCVPSLLKEPRWSSEARVRTAGASATGSGTAMQTKGVLSQGSDSDSSYAVSGTSSARTAKDTPKAKSTKTMRTQRGFLIKDAFPVNSGHSPQGVLRLDGRELPFGEARRSAASKFTPLDNPSNREASPFGVMSFRAGWARGGSERFLAWFVGEICDYTN
jgi:hypothetical protein